MRTMVLVAILSMILASAALAQPQKYDAGVFADLGGTVTGEWFPPFTPFDLYGLAWDLDGGVAGHEGGAIIDPRLIVLGFMVNPPSIICLTCDPTNWWGGGYCLPTVADEWYLLVRWTVMALDPGSDITVCLRSASPSSFVPAAPGYARCDMSLQPFGVAQNGQGFYPDGCFVVNPSQDPPIPNAASSWGSVKARFGAKGP